MPKGVYRHRTGQRAERTPFACMVCGAVRGYTPGQVRHREKYGSGIKYCSQRCAGLANVKASAMVTVSCALCGRSKARRRVLVARVKVSYCSVECLRAASRKPDARWKDPEQIRAYMRDYNDRNRARLTAAHRVYRHAHPEVKRFIQWRRRGAAGRMSVAQWQALLAICGGVCLACGAGGKLQPDHVKPLALAGTNDPVNVQPLCGRCNRMKSKREIDYRTPEQRAAIATLQEVAA